MELARSHDDPTQQVARIELPPSLDGVTVRQLRQSVQSAEDDPRLRLLLLSGTEQAFCQGLDADGLSLPEQAEALRPAIEDFAATLRTIRLGSKPAVALVDGPALGGGVGLAAACDVVVATERASFGLPESLFGLIPAMVLPLLLERMAPQKARLWALTAHRRGAQEALEAGLADEVVPSAMLGRAGKRWTKSLSRARPRAVRALAEFSIRAASLPLCEALAEGAVLTRTAISDPEVRRALRIFHEEGVLDTEAT
jgi:enoyl-CoA hydratase/carnithine racemase